jgi:hypothetical protein
MIRTNLLIAAAALTLGASGAICQTATEAQASANGGGQRDSASAQASGGASASASASGSQRQGEQSASLGAGTAMNAQLSQPVDSKKAKPGDQVTAQTTEAVKADGKTIVPKGSKLVGHVTRSSARAKGDAESALAVEFDRAILKDGREIPLQASIQALAAAQAVAAVGGDELEPVGGVAQSGAASGRGTLGGVGSTVGGAASGAASTVPRTTTGATGAVGSTVGTATGATAGAGSGLSAAGELTSTSRGVFGLNGLHLNNAASNSTEGSLITSTGKNVHLDSGTRLLVVTHAATTATAER